MKDNKDITISAFLKWAVANAQYECPVPDDKYLSNVEDFCIGHFFDPSDAIEFLKELDIVKDGKLKPKQHYIDAGLFETVLVWEKLDGQDVFRWKNFITERGTYFLKTVLTELECVTI